MTLNGLCSIGTNGRGEPGTSITTGSTFNSVGLALLNHIIVHGVAVTGFQDFGISITGNNNIVSCSWIGTADGTTAAPNGGGIVITGSNNLLGTAGSVESGNLISGNIGLGIRVNSGHGNTAYNNWVGFQKSGEAALPNGGGGVKVFSGGQLIFWAGNKIRA